MNTAAGILGGGASWILGNVKLLNELLSLLGTFCGAMVALISLLVKLGEIRRRRRERKAPLTEPPDLEDNIPLR